MKTLEYMNELRIKIEAYQYARSRYEIELLTAINGRRAQLQQSINILNKWIEICEGQLKEVDSIALKAVMLVFNYTYEELIGPSRKGNLPMARHMFFYFSVNHEKRSPRLTVQMINREQATLYIELPKITFQIENYPDVRKYAKEIKSKIDELTA